MKTSNSSRTTSRQLALTEAPTTTGWLDFVSDQVAAHLCNDPFFVDSLTRQVNERFQDPKVIKSIARSVNAEMKIQQLLEVQEFQTSAFAPVFIADLKPDEISANTCAELERLGKVKDLSDLIRLDED